jgi:hypothetical protein
MKTFKEFISEDKMGERLGKMSDIDFEQFLKGRTPEEAKTYRAKRSTFTNSGSAGQGFQDAARQARQGRPVDTSGRAGSPGNSQGGYARRGGGSAPSAAAGSRTPSGGSKIKYKGPMDRYAPFRKGFGAYSAYDAVDAASRGDYGGAATSTILAAQGSRRISSAVPRVQKQVLQKVAPKLAPKLARFVPGLQQAYGITAGSLAAARGDTTGAVLGYGSAIPGPIGYGFVAADIARQVLPQDVKKGIKDRTGITRLQQSKELENKAIQSGQGMTGIARAQQTMSTRDARKASTAYGTKKGSALTGLGGPTKVDTKAGTLTTKDKTVKLASTQLVRDPKTGQQRVGDLAYKGGKAVYLARPSVASRDTSLSANVGRALNLGRYSKEAEQKAAKTEYRTALKNTQSYTKGLGIGTKSATAQKLPGYGTAPAAKPKPAVKPAVAGGGMGGARGGGSSPGSVKPKPVVTPVVKPAVKPVGTTGGTPTNRRGGK